MGEKFVDICDRILVYTQIFQPWQIIQIDYVRILEKREEKKK